MLQSVSIGFPSIGAATADELYGVWPFKGDWQIEEVYYAPATADPADATNYTTLTLSTNNGAAGAFTSIGTLTNATVAFAVDTSREMSISGAGLAIVQGSMLKAAKTEAGTGGILHGELVIVARKVP